MGVKEEPTIYLARKMWEYSKGNRPTVVLFFFMFVIANLVAFLNPLVVAKVLNTIQERGITQESLPILLMYLSVFILLTFGFWMFHGPARVIELRNAFLVRANYKEYLLDGTMALPAEWHTDHHSGDTIDKVNRASGALFSFSASSFEVIETIVKFISSYIALIYFNLHSAYIVLFMVIITVSFILKIDKILIKQYKDLNRAENKISAKVFDTISNITTVIILRIEKLVSNAIMRKIMHPFKLFVYNHKINETKWFLVSLSTSVMTFLVLFSYIYFNIQEGTVLVGTIYVLFGYVNRINSLFYRFAYKYGQIVRQRTNVMNGEEISNEFKKKKRLKSIYMNGNWNELRIKDLKFSYSTQGGTRHLDNINLTIKRGQKIAVIGESGSGKTTFLKLMRDLYTPKYLELYLDSQLLEHGFKTIGDNISLIPQDPEIFSTTIKENITMGVRRTLKDIRKFTNMAQFTHVVRRLPKKLNSSIVEKGVNLSGGEKQRLALSRGLMASEDKTILLLDEPTSSVDSKNELLIYQNIFKKFKKKTVLSSIHRLHLLIMFDNIYFFKKGRIVGSGRLEELLKTSNDFRILWHKYTQTRHTEELKELEEKS